MAYELVRIGTSPNDGTGDNIRDAFDKINRNFIKLDPTSTFSSNVATTSTNENANKFIGLLDTPKDYTTGSIKVGVSPILLGVNNAGNLLTNRLLTGINGISVLPPTDGLIVLSSTFSPSTTATAFTTVIRDNNGIIYANGVKLPSGDVLNANTAVTATNANLVFNPTIGTYFPASPFSDANSIVARDGLGNVTANRFNGTATQSLKALTADSLYNPATDTYITASTSTQNNSVVVRDNDGVIYASNFIVPGGNQLNASTANTATQALSLLNTSTGFYVFATTSTVGNSVVARDAVGRVRAHQFIGTATLATTATNAIGVLNTSTGLYISATTSTTANTIVARDGAGRVQAQQFIGTATLATTATNAVGVLNTSTGGYISATTSTTANTVVARDVAGRVQAQQFIGTATLATTSTNSLLLQESTTGAFISASTSTQNNTIVARDNSGIIYAAGIVLPPGVPLNASTAATSTNADNLLDSVTGEYQQGSSSGTPNTVAIRDLTGTIVSNSFDGTATRSLSVLDAQTNTFVGASSTFTNSTVVVRNSVGEILANRFVGTATNAVNIFNPSTSAFVSASASISANSAVLRDSTGRIQAQQFIGTATLATTATNAISVLNTSTGLYISATTSTTANTVVARDGSGRVQAQQFIGTATQALAITGFTINLVAGPTWGNSIPAVNSTGTVEVGRYIDFHSASGSSEDFTVRLDGGSTGSTTLTVTGNITASGEVNSTSDQRLKSNILTITSALEKTLNLRGVTYVKDNKPSIGLIAQEVAQVIPEVISVADNEQKTMSVAYGNLVGLLVEAIRQLNDKVEHLQNLIEKQ